MTGNTIPQNYEPLVHLLADAVNGASQHGAAVGLKQNDAAALRAALGELIGHPGGPNFQPPPYPGAKAVLNAAVANKSAATAALRSAQSNGRALAMACIGALKPRLGNHWNAAWTEAGFTGGSLQVPANPEFVLRNLQAYYGRHPDHEVPQLTEQLACTADACAGAVWAIATAQANSTQSNVAAAEARHQFDVAVKAARMRLSGLREELARLLADDDHRWYAFGFDRPSHVGSPDTPENLIATPGAPGMLYVDWDDARRADGYRLRAAAADGKLLAESLPQDSAATLTGLPSGSTVSLTVTARNATGESPASEPVTAVVP